MKILLANERRSRTAFSCPKRGLLPAAEVAISGKTGIVSRTYRSKNQRACAHSTRRVIRQHYHEPVKGEEERKKKDGSRHDGRRQNRTTEPLQPSESSCPNLSCCAKGKTGDDTIRVHEIPHGDDIGAVSGSTPGANDEERCSLGSARRWRW